MSRGYSEAAAKEAHAFEAGDRVPGDPATTAWRRWARWWQAEWRAARRLPIGAQPYDGRDGARPVGSRIALEVARASGANLLTPGALAAVRARLAAPEPRQMLSEERLWADLLSSMPMCFNVFGELAGDPELAKRAVRTWWPDTPAGAVAVRFEHSPGRRDRSYLDNQSAFDVAFEVTPESGARAIVGVETKYHEAAQREPPPRASVLERYVEVTERSGVFEPRWREALLGTELQQIWQDHLLVLSMLQHPSSRWRWGRFVLVYPRANERYRALAEAYGRTLADGATFEARTLESILEAPGALPERTVALVRARYLGEPGAR